MRRRVLGALVGATLVGVACTEISTDPTLVVALSFDALPFPTVVAFDTLRDEDGVAQRLRGVALNSAGDPIPDAPVRFLATQPGVTISADGFVIADSARSTTIPIVAQVGGLQSRALQLPITRRPDSVAAEGTIDTLRYVVPDNGGNLSGALRVKVFSNAVAPPAAVRGWIVRFRVEYGGVDLPADHPSIWLQDDSGRRSGVDTTGVDGIASRQLRVQPLGLAAAQDSVVVYATVRALGAPLVGAPVRFVVPIIPR
jgi:hypothetical protein